MTRIVAISGSLRARSYNSALLRAAVDLAPAGAHIEIVSIAGVPLYDGDREDRQGVPASVQQLKDEVAESDGLLLATPEYNNSVPGVLKNAIDWMTRPPSDIGRVFGNRAVAILGATPGMGGTRLAQAAWLPILRTLGTRPWFGKQLYVARAKDVFDTQGRLVDEKVRELLREFVAGFVQFAGAPRSA